ncbi:hypothetical protein ACFX13_004144 [Malus domestica]
MWRRLLSSSQLKTLTLATAGSAATPCRSAAGPASAFIFKPSSFLGTNPILNFKHQQQHRRLFFRSSVFFLS